MSSPSEMQRETQSGKQGERQAAIEVRGLEKTFKVGFGGLKEVRALRGLDLTVRAGEIYGFLGPNGAGKSTTIKILNQLIRPTAGTAVVFGEPLSTPRARRRVGYLPENPVFYDHLTGRELMHHYGDLLRLPREETRRRTEALLERVGLGRAGDLGVRRYSKGMTQRLGIAQALLGDPDVVILDEPVSGLDPVGRREMRDLMLELKAQGKTVFFSTHIIPDVELVCDRVGMIIGGRLVREGSVDELLAGKGETVEIVLAGLSSERAAETFPGLDARSVGEAVSLVVPEAQVTDVLRRALDQGLTVRSVQPQRRALEDLFLEEAAAGREDDAEPRARFHQADAQEGGTA